MKTIGEADLLAKDFMEIGSRLGIRVQCAVTYGEQPIGSAIGPSLEAREALETLMNRSHAFDVAEKATAVAGTILEMAGKADGKALAREILRSGRAEEKMREIIEAQGGELGNPARGYGRRRSAVHGPVGESRPRPLDK